VDPVVRRGPGEPRKIAPRLHESRNITRSPLRPVQEPPGSAGAARTAIARQIEWRCFATLFPETPALANPNREPHQWGTCCVAIPLPRGEETDRPPPASIGCQLHFWKNTCLRAGRRWSSSFAKKPLLFFFFFFFFLFFLPPR